MRLGFARDDQPRGRTGSLCTSSAVARTLENEEPGFGGLIARG